MSLSLLYNKYILHVGQIKQTVLCAVIILRCVHFSFFIFYCSNLSNCMGKFTVLLRFERKAIGTCTRSVPGNHKDV